MCGQTKTEVFEYDDVIHHIRLLLRMLWIQSYFCRFSGFMWTGENDSNALSGRVFFWRFRFQKYPDTYRALDNKTKYHKVRVRSTHRNFALDSFFPCITLLVIAIVVKFVWKIETTYADHYWKIWSYEWPQGSFIKPFLANMLQKL